jgi:hypothetical protein
MPNWRTPLGRQMIDSNPRAWAALMLIFGLEDVLHYILSTEKMTDQPAILAALKIPVQTLPLNLFAPVLY